MAEDGDDFDDARTQPATAALTQLEPTQVAAVVDAAVDVVRCLICSMNITTKSIMERELHLNACLDAASLESRYDCPTCGKELTDYNEQRRLAHVNLCLDRVAHVSSATRLDPPRDEVVVQDNSREQNQPEDMYDCRICGQRLALSGIEARSRHVKQCGQRFGLRAADMAVVGEAQTTIDDGALTQPSITEETTAAAATGGQPNAFSILMASSTQRARPTQHQTTLPSSNAFDIMMKSSKTEAVVAATSSSARSFWHTSTTAKTYKRQRTSASSGASTAPAQASSYNAPRRYSCPDFKRILGTQPPFIVDGFRYASKSLSSVYFLTHFHSDHYTGLQRDFDCGIIYCNQVTAALVVQELGIDSKFVHPLPMNTAVDVRGVQVTFMDANHCPGAAIILFRLRSGVTYLHTGDFRFHPKMWQYAPLKPFLADASSDSSSSARRLDGVYLDTTYADPKYTFPTQEASIQHALTLVDKHMGAGEKVLFLFGSYSVGKERLFMEVASRYQRKVCVSKAKLKMIQTFGWPDAHMKLLTTEPAATNVHVVPMQELKLDHLGALLQKHRLRFHQIVAFRPTGWTFSRSSASLSTCQSDPSGSVRIYGVPYSEHSSFAELCEFIRVLNPSSIIPTVNCGSDRSVKKQLDLIRQSAFRSISSIFLPQTSDATEASPRAE